MSNVTKEIMTSINCLGDVYDDNWITWGTWGECSTSCGSGKQTRWRENSNGDWDGNIMHYAEVKSCFAYCPRRLPNMCYFIHREIKLNVSFANIETSSRQK